MNDKFKATTQYGDWEGTASADDNPSKSLRDYLEEGALIEEGEFLLSASIMVVEGTPYVTAYAYKGSLSSDTLRSEFAATKAPIQTREIRIRISPEDFMNLFKQFSIVLTWRPLDIAGRDYQYEG